MEHFKGLLRLDEDTPTHGFDDRLMSDRDVLHRCCLMSPGAPTAMNSNSDFQARKCILHRLHMSHFCTISC